MQTRVLSRQLKKKYLSNSKFVNNNIKSLILRPWEKIILNQKLNKDYVIECKWLSAIEKNYTL